MQFVFSRIVVFRTGDGNHVVRVIGEADAEVVGLHQCIAAPLVRQTGRADAPEQPTLRIAGCLVRVNPIGKLVPLQQLYTIVSLVVRAVGFAPDGVGDVRFGQQVTLVGGANVHTGRYGTCGIRIFCILKTSRKNLCTLF